MASWLAIPPKSPFSLANLPFGVISTVADGQPHVAVAIGDHALDLHVFAAHDGFAPCAALTPAQRAVFFDPTLNRFAALGRPLHRAVRHYLQALFRAAPDPPALAAVLRDHAALRAAALLPLARVARYHLPLAVGDYTDFFAGRHHARAVGALFRGPAHALHPNYHHVPVAYHGRASSVVVSGTPLHRPRGQVLRRGAGADDDDDGPVFAPCAKLDFELELGMFVARGNELGRPVAVGRAEEHIFGFVLLNDWSARDVQTWEYVPLGPFNAKNFGTSVSPWVVLADALEPFKTAGLDNPVVLQDYLREERRDNVLDIKLEVTLTSACARS